MLQILNSRPSSFIQWVSWFGQIFKTNQVDDHSIDGRKMPVYNDENRESDISLNDISRENSPYTQRVRMDTSPLLSSITPSPTYIESPNLYNLLQPQFNQKAVDYDPQENIKILNTNIDILLEQIKSRDEEYGKLLSKYRVLEIENLERDKSNVRLKRENELLQEKITNYGKIFKITKENISEMYEENKILRRRNELLNKELEDEKTSSAKNNSDDILKRDTDRVYKRHDDYNARAQYRF
jgi:hypothetical protein